MFGLGWVAIELSSIITLFIIGALLAYILDPLASYLEYKGLTRNQATTAIFIALAVVIFLIFYFIVPLVINQVQVIQTTFTSGKGTETIRRLEQNIRQNIPMLKDVNLEFQSKLHTLITHFSQSIFSLVGSLISLITTLVIIPFVVFFLLKDGPKIKKAW